MVTRLRTIGGGALILVSCLCGCGSAPSSESNPYFPANLAGDGYKTWLAQRDAIGGGTEKASAEIPEAYWADRIKALDPIMVYKDSLNIVVVQKNTGGVEQGKYIYIPVSSHMPVSGGGFVFTATDVDNVYNYRRSWPPDSLDTQ